MTEEIIVQSASADDLAAIADIAFGLFPDNFYCLGKNPLDEARAWIRANSQPSDGRHYVVAKAGDSVVGYAHSHTTAHGAGVVVIDEWGKRIGCDLRGIGSRVIQATQDFWVDKHPRRFGRPLTALLIYTGMPGVGLCEKLGFVRVAQMQNLYGQGIDEYLLRKNIQKKDVL